MNARLKFALEQRKKCPEKAFIHSSSPIPDWVKLGKNVIIHENCTIGTQGFGFAQTKNKKWIHIPHVGGVIIGDNVEIYAGTNIDRGTVNNTVIGNGTKIDHHCHIAHNVRVGKNCIITAGVIVGGSTIIGDSVWIGINTAIKDGIKIGSNSLIGMGSVVTKNVDANCVVFGVPAKKRRNKS